MGRLLANLTPGAVFDPSWWGVWLPWLLVWGITVVSLVAAVTIAVTHWRRHRAPAATRRPGISFYLDDDSVMDLYRQYGGKYKAALRQEVQERSSSTSEGEVSVDLAPVRASARRGVTARSSAATSRMPSRSRLSASSSTSSNRRATSSTSTCVNRRSPPTAP